MFQISFGMVTGPSTAARNRAASSSANGWVPGTIDAMSQVSDPGTAPRRNAGTSPARTTLDLPEPLGPTRATSRSSRPSRPTTSPSRRSRPKKSAASDSRKGCRPL